MSNQPKPRTWIIDGDPFVVDDDEQLAAALDEAVTILTRIGGAITVLANRQEVAPGHYHTVSFVFRHNSFAPGQRLEPVADPDEEHVTEPEPVGDVA